MSVARAAEFQRRRGAGRAALMAGTSLPTLLLLCFAGQMLSATPAGAQPAPGARPTGGQVSAGTASISRTSGATTITQSSQRAAVNWQSFDVGSQQQVVFQQPSATSITLNRVESGGASQIAGRIDANGQIALVNPSGVVFYQGAQVNAAAVLVSAAGISNSNFMAGRMAFDQAAPANARIDNRGTITARQAGLAAFVAPQVANSGVINARLGHVVLAGAKTATLDLYGDGLLALDVTGQVTQAPVGPDGKTATALVTNTGTIIADGGTVQLTARAADGLVQTLVQAGGRISAGSVGGKTGLVTLAGIGGSIVIDGSLLATGTAPGTTGGRIEALASNAVTVASGARLDVSGRTGGGTVALGTTLARAAGPQVTNAPRARTTNVQQGATIAADATATGNGGRVVVLSSNSTSMDGTITGQGGAGGGNGGFAEVSGGTVGLTGRVNLSAPAGQPGTVLLDPLDLVISDTQPAGFTPITPSATDPYVAAGYPDTTSLSWITPATVQGLTGNITLQATRDLTVASPLTLTTAGQSLELDAGRNLTVNAPISTLANVFLTATNTTGVTPGISVNAAVSAAGTGNYVDIFTTGAMTLAANLSASQLFLTGGAITQTGGGISTPGSLFVSGQSAILTGGNQVSRVLFNVNQDFTLLNNGDLAVVFSEGPNTAATLNLRTTGALTVTGDIRTTGAALLGAGAGGMAIAGFVNSGGGGLTLLSDGRLSFGANSTISTGGGPLEVAPSTAGVAMEAGGLGAGLSFGVLPVQNGPSAALAPSLVRFGAYTDPVTGSQVTTAGHLALIGAWYPAGLTVPTLDLHALGAVTQTVPITNLGTTGATGGVTGGLLTGGAGSVTLNNPGNRIPFLGPFSTTGNFRLADAVPLSVAGLVQAGTGATIQFQADSLTFAGSAATPTVVAPAGTVAVEPLTAGRPVALVGTGGTAPANALTLGTADLAQISTGTLALGSAQAGPVSIIGAVDLTGRAGELSVTTPLAFTEAGSITVGTLAARAALVSLPGPGNLIATLGNIAAPGGLSLADAQGLLIAGPITSGNVAISAAGDAVFAGRIIATALRIDAAGSIVRTGGVFAIGTLTGSAGTNAAFGAGTAVGTLGAFAVPNGLLSLSDGQPMTILGPISAQSVDLAATGQLVLAGDITGLGTGTSTLQVLAGPPAGDGCTCQAPASPPGPASFVQSGQVTVADGPGTAPELVIALPGAGTMTFAGLHAPGVGLVLDAGSGSITGTMAVGSLLVQGTGGSARLQGSVAGDTTGGAAARARTEPVADPAYTFNRCEIGTPFCTGANSLAAQTAVLGGLIAFQLVPSGLPPPVELTPLVLLPLPSFTPPPQRLTDPDVVPPNISDRDY